jgi:hypothetical protein
MRKSTIMLLFVAAVFSQSKSKSYAQGMAVNASGAAANNSAMLDVSSTSQGVLVPRMLSGQRLGISSPATGLLVYQTDAPSGFYYYDGSDWVSLSTGTPSGAAGGDLTGTYPNPSIATGSISNAKLANSSVTVNGSTVALGSSTTISAMPSGTAGGNLGGTYPNPSIASLPVISGANLTNLNASNLSSGTVPTARLGSGSASSSTYLRGDGSWATPTGGGGGSTIDLVATNTATQAIGASSVINLSFNNVITAVSLGGSFNGTTYTVGTSGNYIITVSAATDASTQLHLVIEVNGSEIAYGGSSNASALAANRARSGVSAVVALTAGNTVKMTLRNTSPSTPTTITTDGTTRLTIAKL